MQNLDPNEKTEWTLEEMFEKVAMEEDVIFTLAAESLPTVRSGLASIKHRENQNLEKNGIAADKRKLTYQILSTEENTGMVKVRIKFMDKKTITVAKVETPGDF